jgi:hypothetical protein
MCRTFPSPLTVAAVVEHSVIAELQAHEALHRRQRALVIASLVVRGEATLKHRAVRR